MSSLSHPRLSHPHDAILSCVPPLVAGGGYQGIRHTDIAAMAGIRTERIQTLYPDRSDLLAAFVVAERDRAASWMQGLEDAALDPHARLERYVAEWATCLEESGAPFGICALLATELPLLPARPAQALQAYFHCWSDWLASVLEEGARQGRLRLARAPDVEAKIFMATVQGAVLSARVHGDAALFDAIVTGHMRRLA